MLDMNNAPALKDLAPSQEVVRAAMNEFQRATADRLLELAAHFGCVASAFVGPRRKGGPFTFLPIHASAPSSAVVDLNRHGGASVRARRSTPPEGLALASKLALAVTDYRPAPTGRMVPCDGDAHSNAFIDHCMVCLPWGWGKVPEYKPFDLDEARAQLRDVPRPRLPFDDALEARIAALVASGELIEYEARRSGKGYTCGFSCLRWNLKKVASPA